MSISPFKHPLVLNLVLVFIAGLSFSFLPAPQQVKPQVNILDSLDYKIGQMIMVGIGDLKSLSDSDQVLRDLRECKAGGIILFEKNIDADDPAVSLKNLTLALQEAGGSKLFIGIDEEGGKVHRLKEKYGFVAMPSAEYLGKLNNTDSALFYNRRLANQMKGLGINVNFAPCLDLALNPENTVIVKSKRSFSNDPAVVSTQAQSVIRAHLENGIIPVSKHFPGHGSSRDDSHAGMVDVSRSWQSNELIPYKFLIEEGMCPGIMTAHLVNRSLDTGLLPATLSINTIRGLLRGYLNYNGVVFSDDMQMYAISKNYGLERAIELSINAGVDVLMFANNTDKTLIISASEVHAIIKKLVLQKRVSLKVIDEAYYRIKFIKNFLK